MLLLSPLCSAVTTFVIVLPRVSDSEGVLINERRENKPIGRRAAEHQLD